MIVHEWAPCRRAQMFNLESSLEEKSLILDNFFTLVKQGSMIDHLYIDADDFPTFYKAYVHFLGSKLLHGHQLSTKTVTLNGKILVPPGSSALGQEASNTPGIEYLFSYIDVVNGESDE